MTTRLVLAAHGTHSAAGADTIRALADALRARRQSIRVELGYLDVQSPSLAEVIDSEPAVVVPLLLSAGYHVTTDIPQIVTGRDGVLVARHLGPDPVIVAAVAERLAQAGSDGQARTTLLAVVPSSRESARAEAQVAANLLGERLGRAVTVLPLSSHPDLSGFAAPVEVATYLLAEGGFLDALRASVGGSGQVADPVGVHPALVDLVWARYDETAVAV